MKIIDKIVQAQQNIFNHQPKPQYDHGMTDIIDLISYSGLEEKENYLKIENKYIRSLFISGYPYNATSGWLNSLVNFNDNLDISFHIFEIDSVLALPKLNRKITELESTKRSLIRSGQIIGPEISDPLKSAKELRDKITRGQEKLFQVAIYICLNAENLAELNRITQTLQSVLSSRLFYSKVAYFQQVEALQSMLPRADDCLAQRRNLDTTSASLTFPFMSSELVHSKGILYGVNKSNNTLVILDRFNLINANSIIFAQSGSGKSYASKVEILRQLIQGTSVIVIDPEREYLQLNKSFKGTYIKLSAKSKQKINPFDLSTTSKNKNQLNEHIQDLIEVLSIMLGGLNNGEKSILDKAVLITYKNYETPVLKDLYNVLIKLGHIKLSDRLEKYITGSLSGVFNKHTNIDLSNQLVIFDIKDLPESIRQIMMMVISIYIKNQIKTVVKKRLLVIDEGWMLLENEESARFITGLVRRARKYYLGVSIISQAANDFLNNDFGKAIASQSSLRILMRQDSTTIENVSKQFKLSSYEKNYLLTCEKGEALVIADQNHAAVKVIASEKEHPLITTNPLEIYNL